MDVINETRDLLSVKEASRWASGYLGKRVTSSNISYLVQYGRIQKYSDNGLVQISKSDLIRYYEGQNGSRESNWKEQLGDDLNWTLSFDSYTEAQTTKHVNRLHPYKGKFIPQLVEYFLDQHTDRFKQDVFFRPGDLVLDPFCGSGTTLVQASELGIKALGIDISYFNTMISNCKVGTYNTGQVQAEINRINRQLKCHLSDSHILDFEGRLLIDLNKFNQLHFPVPEYKYRLRRGEINEAEYGSQKEAEFKPIYDRLVSEYHVELRQSNQQSFLDKWFSKHVRDEIEFVHNEIQKITDFQLRSIVSLILSRTMRSCRATAHADLATLIEPVFSTYYCAKHGKVCKPLFSILKWWLTYSADTIKRLYQYEKLRTDRMQICLTGDSRTIDIAAELHRIDPSFAEHFNQHKIKGIFSSPPYVGLIDYHEQHAYAYDLFGYPRQDELEIGPLYKGQGREARESYIEGISQVLVNCKRFLADDYDVFLVANDKFNLYPVIARKSGMTIVNQYKRPVLNRTEKDKGAYSEIIFHLKEKAWD